MRTPPGKTFPSAGTTLSNPHAIERSEPATRRRDLENPGRPPARSTRRNSRKPASRSSTLRTPKPTVTASNDASPNGNASMSPCTHEIAGSLSRAPVEHPLREIESDRFGPRRARTDREIAVPHQASST